MESFKYRPSILNIGVLIWIFFCISLLLVDRQNISDESGSGVLEVSKYIGIGMLGIVIDLLIQKFIANRTLRIAIQIIVLLLIFLFIFI